MEELVFLKNDEVFTDSLVIAEMTGNQHKSITALIRKQKSRLERFGRLRFSDFKSLNPQGGRPQKVFLLNEQQATLLITFMDNTEKVADFKATLVEQFYKMRQFILERQSADWQETRRQGKITRKSETDVIRDLVEYAKHQGSEHSEMLYTVYSKLANTMGGIKKRDEATVPQLNRLEIFENLILQMIRNGMAAGMAYKEIYQVCKERCLEAKRIAMIG